MGDRHATRRRPPAAEFEDFIGFNPEVVQSGIQPFFREVGGNRATRSWGTSENPHSSSEFQDSSSENAGNMTTLNPPP